MALVHVELPLKKAPVPDEVIAFLGEADTRISDFFRNRPLRGGDFVPSDYVAVYHALRAITESNLACGTSFCEWGSGFGVVASLAAMLKFDASGIESERGLVVAAQQLADDFVLPVRFVHGSFIPPGSEALMDEAYRQSINEFFWLVMDSDAAYEELDLGPDELDVVFAYPWPDEESVIERMFERVAATGSLLLTHHAYQTVRLQRKA